MEQNTSVTAGTSFFTLLGVAFIIMKLCGVIDWSWLWVLAPLWGPLALGGIILIVLLIIALIDGK